MPPAAVHLQTPSLETNEHLSARHRDAIPSARSELVHRHMPLARRWQRAIEALGESQDDLEQVLSA